MQKNFPSLHSPYAGQPLSFLFSEGFFLEIPHSDPETGFDWQGKSFFKIENAQ